MTREDIVEMKMAASASVGLFPRVEIDPAHLIELCDLALNAARTACAGPGHGGCEGCDYCWAWQ